MAIKSDYRITARVDGKEQKVFNFGEQTLHIPAAENTVYQIEEIGRSAIPDNIVFSRVGNDLWIMPEGTDVPQAIIENYYSTKKASFGAVGFDGSLYSYGVEDLNTAPTVTEKVVEHTLAEEVSHESVTAAGGESSGGLSVPVISAAALAVGGIAVAVGAGGGGGHDDPPKAAGTDKKANDANSHQSNEMATAENNDSHHLATKTAPLGAIDFIDSAAVPAAQPGAGNHHQLAFYDSAAEFVKGQAQAGDHVTIIQIENPQHNGVTYHLQTNHDIYNINHLTGEITLTKQGAEIVNNGQELPVIEAIAYDGNTPSEVARLDIADHSLLSADSIHNEALQIWHANSVAAEVESVDHAADSAHDHNHEQPNSVFIDLHDDHAPKAAPLGDYAKNDIDHHYSNLNYTAPEHVFHLQPTASENTLYSNAALATGNEHLELNHVLHFNAYEAIIPLHTINAEHNADTPPVLNNQPLYYDVNSNGHIPAAVLTAHLQDDTSHNHLTIL